MIENPPIIQISEGSISLDFQRIRSTTIAGTVAREPDSVVTSENAHLIGQKLNAAVRESGENLWQLDGAGFSITLSNDPKSKTGILDYTSAEVNNNVHPALRLTEEDRIVDIVLLAELGNPSSTRVLFVAEKVKNKVGFELRQNGEWYRHLLPFTPQDSH